jgi:hypothetical protein
MSAWVRPKAAAFSTRERWASVGSKPDLLISRLRQRIHIAADLLVTPANQAGHEIRHVDGAKLNQALIWNVRTLPAMRREKAQAAPAAMRRRGADCSVVCA